MAAVINSIPASQLVGVQPSVLTAGGAALNLSGMLLTTNKRIPIGTPLSFPSAASVGAYFGLSSVEYTASQVYFLAFSGATATPGALWFTQYPVAAVGAYMRGGVISSLSLTALQSISGTLSVLVNGTAYSGSPNLSAATSFSNAASIISTALAIPATPQSSFTGSITTTTLTVTAVASGALAAGQTLAGTGITAGTIIVSQITGTTGGIGTYQVSASQTVASEAMTTTLPAVTYDSISGALVVTSNTTGTASTMAYATGTVAASLCLTAATGAVLSQGAVAGVPGTYMSALVLQTTNWATFSSLFDPDAIGATGNAQKMLFAAWVNAQNDKYAYIPFDNDPNAAVQGNTTNMGALLIAGNYSGTAPVYEPVAGTLLYNAVFAMSIAAAINFNVENGATDFAYRTQTGLAVGVTNAQIATNLQANGYNYFGTYATATVLGNIFYPGTISGPFDYLDAYIEQIWLNAAMQQTLFLLPQNVGTIPFNAYGAALIESSQYGNPQSPGPIDNALSFGAIQPGVVLSASQVQEINNAAGGRNIAPIVAARGWYLLVIVPGPTVRATRGPWPIQFWYTQGGSVQTFNLSSVLVQ